MILTRFLRWWLGQLTACLPAALRSRDDGRGDTLLVRERGDSAGAWLSSRGRMRELGRLGASPEDVLAPLRPARTRVVVVPEKENVLVRDIRLPLAAEEDLQQVLAFEMSRRTPFRAEDVHYAYRVLDRMPQRAELLVRLLVAPRRRLDPLLSRLSRLDLTPTWMLAEEASGDAGLVFLPRGFRAPRTRLITTGLLVLNAAALSALAIIPVHQQAEALRVLGQRLGAARERANAVMAYERRLSELKHERSYLVSQRAAFPPMVMVLEEASRLLPAGTWLTRLEVRDRQVHLHGYSDHPSALISRIQRSTLFADPRFASPVLQDTAMGSERFHIRVRLRRSWQRAFAHTPSVRQRRTGPSKRQARAHG